MNSNFELQRTSGLQTGNYFLGTIFISEILLNLAEIIELCSFIIKCSAQQSNLKINELQVLLDLHGRRLIVLVSFDMLVTDAKWE